MAEEKKRSYIRILSKDKEGCLCYFPGVGKKRTTWKEFDDYYEIDPNDKFKAYLKKDKAEKFKKAQEHFDQAQLYFFMTNGANVRKDASESIASTMALMECIRKAAKVLEVTEGEAMAIFRKNLQMTTNGFLKMGIGIGGDAQSMLSAKQKKRNEKNKARIEVEREAEKQQQKVKEALDAENRKTYNYTPFANLKVEK